MEQKCGTTANASKCQGIVLARIAAFAQWQALFLLSVLMLGGVIAHHPWFGRAAVEVACARRYSVFCLSMVILQTLSNVCSCAVACKACWQIRC
jgi:hypothetical protein